MKHKKTRTIEQMNRDISRRLLDAHNLIEILEDMAEGESKKDLLIRMAKKQVRNSFEDIQKCRKILSITN